MNDRAWLEGNRLYFDFGHAVYAADIRNGKIGVLYLVRGVKAMMRRGRH